MFGKALFSEKKNKKNPLVFASFKKQIRFYPFFFKKKKFYLRKLKFEIHTINYN
jgi:hypothetical protein